MNWNQTIAVTLAVASTGGSWNRYGKEEPRDPFEARPEKYRKAAEPSVWQNLPVDNSRSKAGMGRIDRCKHLSILVLRSTCRRFDNGPSASIPHHSGTRNVRLGKNEALRYIVAFGR